MTEATTPTNDILSRLPVYADTGEPFVHFLDEAWCIVAAEDRSDFCNISIGLAKCCIPNDDTRWMDEAYVYKNADDASTFYSTREAALAAATKRVLEEGGAA